MAKMPKIGTLVRCPPDRGDKGYQGTVTLVEPTVHDNGNNIKFQWIHVRHPQGYCSVWPSHRIGYPAS